MKIFFNGKAIVFLFSLLCSLNLFAQKPKLQVSRCSGASRTLPVRNIHVDADNVKWVSNPRGFAQVRACDLGTPAGLTGGENSALLFRGGNADVRWTAEALAAQVKSEVTVSAAFYDAAKDILWLGTKEHGLLQFKTKPALTLTDKFTTGNSKLRSNEINTIFQDKTGRLWVGTRDGLLTGAPGRWKGELAGFDVQRIREYGADVYVLADGEFWLVERGEKFKAFAIPDNAVESDPIDFDFDLNGQLWMLSAIVTRLDLLTDEFETFSGPEDYTSQFGTCIAADLDGAVWVGTEDKGLYVIDKASSITVNIIAEKELSCTGNGRDAALRVKVSGGKAPFTYQWSASGLTGEAPRNLGPGDYTLTVTDAAGKSKSAKITLADPTVRAEAQAKQAESGAGKADGQAEVSVSGGSSPYAYNWDNGETTALARKLAEGRHSVTVTDARGCSATASVAVTQKVATLEVTLAATGPIPCNTATTGLKTTVSGGKGPYKYSWSNTAFSGEQAANARAGEYRVTVTDALGITASALLKVTEPEALTAQVAIQSPASTGKTDGKALVQPQGGTPPFIYQWDNGETAVSATRLGAGSHNVKITDANGCSASFVFNLPENILPLAVSIAETGNIQCVGDKTALKLTVSGGKAPFKYTWNNPALAGNAPTGVGPGNFTVTVTDAAGGTATGNFTVKEPVPVVASAQAQKPAATGKADGKAIASGKGGSGEFSFKWDNGETTAEAVKLAPGAHTVSVSDENGCQATASVTITENILPLSVAVEETGKITCNGNKTALKANVSGGKGPFRFTWNNPGLGGETPADVPAGNFTVTVTDATGATTTGSFTVKEPAPVTASAQAQRAASTGNADGKATASGKGGTGNFSYKWDTGEASAEAVRLGPGAHTVTVTDANGCTATASVSITENILPLQIAISEAGKIKCAGDKTTLKATVSGGKGPFRFAWSNPALTGDSPSGVTADDYSVTVTDATGSSATDKFTLVQPAPVNVVATVQAPASVGKSDGRATAQPRGGTGNFIYTWDNGETSPAASRLGAGKHTVTATDANGCAATATIEVLENILPLTLAVEAVGQIKCASETVSLKTTVGGGKGPFQFAWSDPAISGENPKGVGPGDYQLTVTDATGATQAAAVSVKAPAGLKVEIVRNIGATTERSNDGRAFAKAVGGSGTPVYAWDNGETTAQAKKLGIGRHQVTVTDGNGCAITASTETQLRILPALTMGQLQNGQTIKMEQLRFEADSSRLNADCYPILDEVYNFLEENGGIVIEIGGHTNSTPPDEFCDRLSTARAKAAADYLISKGIAPQRVAYKGYGKRKPIASNATAEGRKTNQRVEIKILKLDN